MRKRSETILAECIHQASDVYSSVHYSKDSEDFDIKDIESKLESIIYKLKAISLSESYSNENGEFVHSPSIEEYTAEVAVLTLSGSEDLISNMIHPHAFPEIKKLVLESKWGDSKVELIKSVRRIHEEISGRQLSLKASKDFVDFYLEQQC